MLMSGTLKCVVAAFRREHLDVIDSISKALDDYKKEPFSLDRRSKYNQIYGSKAISIIRRFSSQYPEFLQDKYFAFFFGDESKVNHGKSRLTGLRLAENAKYMIDTQALTVFVQVLLKTFDIEETVFLTPNRKIEMRGGEFYVTELVSVTKGKITDRNALGFIKEQVMQMDERIKAKNE